MGRPESALTLGAGSGAAIVSGAGYLRRGLRIARQDPRPYLQALAVFAAPSLVAGLLAATVPQPAPWQRVAVLGLPWVTVVLGAAVVMMVVGYHARGRRIGLARATWLGLTWSPRYLWTNAHTSVLFWVPMAALLEARAWSAAVLPADGGGGTLVAALWWVAIATVALALHTRTLLAPFLAVHADLPGTLATVEAWRLSGRHFGVCLGTLLLASLPVALPFGLVALAAYAALERSGLPLEPALAAAPNLAWVGIQAVRPLLIPALYALYGDLWHAEQARRDREGAPPLPAVARALLALTRPLPKLGRW